MPWVGGSSYLLYNKIPHLKHSSAHATLMMSNELSKWNESLVKHTKLPSGKALLTSIPSRTHGWEYPLHCTSACQSNFVFLNWVLWNWWVLNKGILELWLELFSPVMRLSIATYANWPFATCNLTFVNCQFLFSCCVTERYAFFLRFMEAFFFPP